MGLVEEHREVGEVCELVQENRLVDKKQEKGRLLERISPTSLLTLSKVRGGWGGGGGTVEDKGANY